MLRFLTLILMAVLLASCAKSRRFESPYPREERAAGLWSVESGAELAAAMSVRTSPHETLWMKADLTIKDERRRGRTFFTALLAWQAPDAVRLRGTRAPIGAIFEVLMDSTTGAIYFNREKRLFEGTREELLEKTELLGGLTPADLVSAVFVLNSLGEALAGHHVAVDQGEALLVGARHAGSGRQLLWLVRKVDGLARELLVRSPGGVEELRIRYEGYKLFEWESRMEPLPVRLQVEVPGQGVLIDVAVSEYRLGPLDPRLLSRRPEAREVYPLAALEVSEAP